ncbi:MAG: hypothetical protein MJ239_01200 [Bacilli bacterium]|nr:hypothetical protein [Bacilli bacterium]
MKKVFFIPFILLLTSCGNSSEPSLSTPKDLSVFNNVLKCSEVESATSYSLLVNGVEKLSGDKPSFNLLDADIAGYATLRVVASNAEQKSNPSFGIRYLNDPKSLLFSSNELNRANVDEDGVIHTFGDNSFGQLGHGADTDVVDLPVAFSQVSCGVDYMVGLTNKGKIYTWGGNEFGQLGCEDSKGKPSEILKDLKFSYVSAGSFHCAAISEEGYVYTWGRNDMLQSGSELIAPSKVSERKFKYVHAGSDYSVFIDNDGYVYASGNNAGRNISKNEGDYLPLTVISQHGGYEEAGVTDKGVFAIKSTGEMEYLNLSIKSKVKGLESIQTSNYGVVCKDLENNMYKADIVEDTLILTKLTEEKIVSYDFFGKTVHVVNENMVEGSIVL